MGDGKAGYKLKHILIFKFLPKQPPCNSKKTHNMLNKQSKSGQFEIFNTKTPLRFIKSSNVPTHKINAATIATVNPKEIPNLPRNWAQNIIQKKIRREIVKRNWKIETID